MINLIDNQLKHLKETSDHFLPAELRHKSGSCQVLTHAQNGWDVLVWDDEETEKEVKILLDEAGKAVYPVKKGKPLEWDTDAIAALLQIRDDLNNAAPRLQAAGKLYTREGMMKRVLEERREKAEKSCYKITFADNIYGEHILTNETGVRYRVTLRDFEQQTGYIDNPDLRTNKLGTTKHIMYAFQTLKARPKTFARLGKRYPFIEIYLDPQQDYRITWYYPHAMSAAQQALITKYFGKSSYLKSGKVKDFAGFITEAQGFSKIKIRPEVEQKVQQAWNQAMLRQVENDQQLDFSLIKAKLFGYQEAGIRFATFREGAILADEMGLGKTIQAIATAVMKKKLFGFKKCLVICPASLKEQWKQEIERFSHEKAVVVQGFPRERRQAYRDDAAFFAIANYETVLRDVKAMNEAGFDFIILDEAQRIKNFSTVTAQNIKKLEKKHALVITGTPIENRLTDLYSVMQFIDPGFLAPLWEFSYQHCYFDESKKDKITGYYNLTALKERLAPVLLRREKAAVLKDLPKVTEINVPVEMHPDQADYHASFAKGVASILVKKYISPYDMQRLMLLLANMRMVCDSTYLIDKQTNQSPKLEELAHILTEKLDIKNQPRKVIIFSEWTQMLNLIAEMLRKKGIGYAQLTGKVAVRHRGQLVKKFETDDSCKVFLSTEAGGSGLNLQVADTVINFELPWNPAKKNQRIGRIDRLGQLSKQLTVINFITRNSIEIKIASGLTLKQNLFDGVLSPGNTLDAVDFSASGRSQFLVELEQIMTQLTEAKHEDNLVEEALAETQGSFGADTVSALTAEENETEEVLSAASQGAPVPPTESAPPEMMEKVLNNGMEFLSGLLQMATGKNAGLQDKKVEIDPTTGEIVMRFKLPSL